MGKRGPKAVDIGRLSGEAYVWTMFFLTLRDGSPGLITKVEYDVPETRLIPVVEINWHEVGRPELTRGRRPVLRRIQFGRIKAQRSEVVSPTREKLEKYLEFAERFKGDKSWHLTAPVLPLPEMWKRFCRARSVADFQRLARSLRRIGRVDGQPYDLLFFHSKDLLKAKRLPNYPKCKPGRRPTSDDKRIHFFAKVLAGLKLGIAPATATKRLSRLPLPVRGAPNWAERYKADFFKTPTKEHEK